MCKDTFIHYACGCVEKDVPEICDFWRQLSNHPLNYYLCDYWDIGQDNRPHACVKAECQVAFQQAQLRAAQAQQDAEQRRRDFENRLIARIRQIERQMVEYTRNNAPVPLVLEQEWYGVIKGLIESKGPLTLMPGGAAWVDQLDPEQRKQQEKEALRMLMRHQNLKLSRRLREEAERQQQRELREARVHMAAAGIAMPSAGPSNMALNYEMGPTTMSNPYTVYPMPNTGPGTMMPPPPPPNLGMGSNNLIHPFADDYTMSDVGSSSMMLPVPPIPANFFHPNFTPNFTTPPAVPTATVPEYRSGGIAITNPFFNAYAMANAGPSDTMSNSGIGPSTTTIGESSTETLDHASETLDHDMGTNTMMIPQQPMSPWASTAGSMYHALQAAEQQGPGFIDPSTIMNLDNVGGAMGGSPGAGQIATLSGMYIGPHEGHADHRGNVDLDKLPEDALTTAAGTGATREALGDEIDVGHTALTSNPTRMDTAMLTHIRRPVYLPQFESGITRSQAMSRARAAVSSTEVLAHKIFRSQREGGPVEVGEGVELCYFAIITSVTLAQRAPGL
ncbi:hypothetical protein NA57DRAFT_74374 [Rhizodiscina lignyota]|uniref:Uncharacterized protein n=1 Tax=Rhizodiscina lignyota TaxID=1504668 RepID=A0A9P4IJH0_9PEZI|nr:hypothetical protein NA57DRAFT_74374 [Rhizodiscina lignyota]